MRKGSALLIVLGMLSFMVISAVAFSAYMRYSRLPSSYLRRASASRLLVKAALAEAIDEIDAAIGNNPHPGVGTHAYTYDETTNSRREGSSQNRNTWFHRVYMGMENLNNDQDIQNNLVSADNTVSTLTLEGLAYIPPPLVNEARYYSRRSKAAQWKNLDFESGRYAFCALDVSDYLDVNSLGANFGRGSAPATRFSLAYLFEEPTQHKSYLLQPDAWDTFIRKFWKKTAPEASLENTSGEPGQNTASRADASRVPLVSLADFNLALHALMPAGLTSPFGQFIQNGNSFYGGIGDTGAAAETIRGMTFVTDGFFPPDPEVADGNVLDLTDVENQPFTKNELQRNAPQLSTIMENSSPCAKKLQPFISGLGLAMLYDYLDDDNVPVSLALPSVERVPMIAAFEHDFANAKLAITPSALGSDYCVQTGGPVPASLTTQLPGVNALTIQYAQAYKIDGGQFAAPGTVKALLAYPFRRGRDIVDPDSFTVDGLVEFFFTSGNMTFRTDNSSDLLHVKLDGTKLAPATPCDGVFAAQLSEKNYSVGNVNPTREDDSDVLKEVTLNTQSAASQIAGQLNNLNFLVIVRQRTAPWVPNPGLGGSYVDPGPQQTDPIIGGKGDGSATTSCGIPPLTANGAVDPEFATAATLQGWLAGGQSKKLRLRMAVHLRVKNGDGKTVDQVPACFGDDHTEAGQNDNNGRGSGPRGAFMNIDGGMFPVMRIDSACEVEVSQAGVSVVGGAGSAQFALSPKAAMCPDPRWNYAPEHWFTPGDTISKSDWLAKCGRDTDGRDCDIFMATSDAGYLQSPYEIAFLPRIMDKFSGNKDYGLVGSPTKGNANWNTSLADCSHNGLFWRTYTPYPRDGQDRDPFEKIPLVSEGGGMKVNPYSDGTNAVLAALANTPVDWWAAADVAEPNVGVPTAVRKSATDFNKKYAWSAMNSNAKFAWEDLKAIAQNIIGHVRANRQNAGLDITDWEEKWDNLGWDDENEDVFCGATLTDTDVLFDVDRKFLYGYWRDCFAPKQQLFLVFVRAEPTMTGGSGIRQMPPQLGARAVALVWRDPNPSNDDYSPHQTRILFYRQFD